MAGKIPEKFIDELLARVDIVDVIDARVPLKKAGRDYKVCHLEGLWWGEHKTGDFTHLPKSQWNWKLSFACPPSSSPSISTMPSQP
jgi:DNA primase